MELLPGHQVACHFPLTIPDGAGADAWGHGHGGRRGRHGRLLPRRGLTARARGTRPSLSVLRKSYR